MRPETLVRLLAATLTLLVPAATSAQGATGVPRFEVYGSIGAGGLMDDESYRGAGLGAGGGFGARISRHIWLGVGADYLSTRRFHSLWTDTVTLFGASAAYRFSDARVRPFVASTVGSVRVHHTSVYPARGSHLEVYEGITTATAVGIGGGFVAYTSPSMFIGADVRVTSTVGAANPRVVTLGQFRAGYAWGGRAVAVTSSPRATAPPTPTPPPESVPPPVQVPAPSSAQIPPTPTQAVPQTPSSPLAPVTGPAGSFGDLPRKVHAGQIVIVMDRSGRDTKGKVETVSNALLVILKKDEQGQWSVRETFLPPGVVTVKRTGPIWDKALLGFGIAAGVSLIGAGTCDGCSTGNVAGAVMAAGAIGAGIGFAFDAAFGPKVVYRTSGVRR